MRDVGTLTQRFMRIERFIPFWAEELTSFTTPFEASNGYSVKLDKVIEEFSANYLNLVLYIFFSYTILSASPHCRSKKKEELQSNWYYYNLVILIQMQIYGHGVENPSIEITSTLEPLHLRGIKFNMYEYISLKQPFF